MKNTILIILLISSVLSLRAQDSKDLDKRLGYRITRDGNDYIIYMDNSMNPDLQNVRKLNYRVFFRRVVVPLKTIDNKTYQLITIPGKTKELKQNKMFNVSSSNEDPRNGKSIDKPDYDFNFWIDTIYLNRKITDIEYHKYANGPFTGLLTSPFKYRLKSGSVKESFIDGSFNVSPFFGWKWRVSSKNPYYFSPIIYVGITTLSYSSADNTGITDSKQKENGVGVTYGGGLVVRLGVVSPGIIIGWDHGFGDLGKTFTYSDHPWISFSMNFDFFEPKKDAVQNN
jgi:hypothetical protein